MRSVTGTLLWQYYKKHTATEEEKLEVATILGAIEYVAG